LGCDNLDVIFSADSLNSNWSYLWNFGDGQTSQQWGVSGYQFMQSGCYDISLTLTSSNGCSSTLTETNAICVIDNPVASFNVNNQVISTLEPIVTFNNTSYDATSYVWQFGDNTTSIVENPIHQYPADPALYEVILIASNNIGCVDTAIMSILLYQELELFVPNTFTPNDDEYNQVFLPVLTDGFKESSYVLNIFNRWGELIFESHDYKIGWDGTYGDQIFECQTGTYTWKISVEVLQTGERKLFHGHVNLIK
jgi:gliding motility-associated-like protein